MFHTAFQPCSYWSTYHRNHICYCCICFAQSSAPRHVATHILLPILLPESWISIFCYCQELMIAILDVFLIIIQASCFTGKNYPNIIIDFKLLENIITNSKWRKHQKKNKILLISLYCAHELRPNLRNILTISISWHLLLILHWQSSQQRKIIFLYIFKPTSCKCRWLFNVWEQNWFLSLFQLKTINKMFKIQLSLYSFS